MGDPGPAADLEGIVRLESGPELVNDGVDTAPSKRILNAYPQYAKTIDGPLVIAEAGLDAIRSTCPHADDWLRELEGGCHARSRSDWEILHLRISALPQ